MKLKPKHLHIAMSLALCFVILMSLAGFDAHCESVRGSVLRLHILANSDSDFDRSVKLSVRDRVLESCSDLFEGARDLSEAEQRARESLPRLEKVAKAELERLGCDLPVTVEVGEDDFDTRTYGDVTLPAGRYTAVRVLLGAAEGHNWWCVCDPNICLAAAGQKQEISSVLDEENTRIVTSGGYKVRFKIVELYAAGGEKPLLRAHFRLVKGKPRG